MFTDPLSLTYNSTAKSLPRIASAVNSTVYRTADGEFEVSISNNPPARDGTAFASIVLARRLPDPTPSNVFDDYRMIRNAFGITYGFDLTRAETSVDIPLLRTALLAFVDSTIQGRLIAGEK